MKTGDHDSLLELLDSWFALSESGHSVTPEEHCARHPELLSAFVRVLSRDSVAEGIFREAREGDEPTASETPGLIGEFEIVSTLGIGGSGTVYLARQQSLDRMVALKVLRAHPGSDPKAELRLRREAELIASLEHPHIVPIFAVGEDEGRVWLAMKHLDGPGLDHLSEALEPKEIARIGAAAARALHEAHQAGIIHRDIKPSNIMLDDGTPFVLDFGLARTADEISIASQEGRVAGTLPYMSPEQLRSQGSKVAIDSRTDIYSLGATLYEWAAGHRPFRSTETGDLIRQILVEDPAPPCGRDRDLSTIILKCLEKDRDLRYSTALELSCDLQRWSDGRPIVARRQSLPGRAWKLVRRHPRASTLAAAAVLATGILGGLLFLNHDREQTRFGTTIASITEEIDRGRYPLARSLLHQATDEWPNDPELQRLQKRFHAATTLEDLIDLLQSNPESQDLSHLRRTIQRLEDMGGIQGPPSKAYTWQLARSLALIFVNDQPRAVQAIEALPDARAKQALLLSVTPNSHSGSPAWNLPEAGDYPLVDYLFTSLAMRVAGRGGGERLSEIKQGRALDETNWRLILQELIYRSFNGEDPRANYYGLQGLSRNGEYPPVVRRLMLWQATLISDKDLLRHVLERHAAEISPECLTSTDYALRARAKLRFQDPEAALKIAQAGLARWPKSYNLLIDQATAQASLTRFDQADTSLKLALAAASTAKERADATITLAQLRLLRLPALNLPLLTPFEGAATPEVDQVIQELLQVIKGMQESPPVVEGAKALAARALFARGRFAESHKLLDLPKASELKKLAPLRAAALFEAAHQGWIRCVMEIYSRRSPKPEWVRFEKALKDVHQGLAQHAQRAEACLEAWEAAAYATSANSVSSEREALAAVMKVTFLAMRRQRKEASLLIEKAMQLPGTTEWQQGWLDSMSAMIGR